MIYPYDIEFAPVLRHKSMFKDLEIVKVLSPKGWGFTQKDAATADGGSKIGITVESDFENSLNGCENLLLIDSYNSIDFKKFIKKT